jgi:hypothetical protein
MAGIGKSKLEMYGKEILKILASHGEAKNSDKKEDANG